MSSPATRFADGFRRRFASKFSKKSMDDACPGATQSHACSALEPEVSVSSLEESVTERSRLDVKEQQERAFEPSLADATGGGDLAFDVPPEIDFGRFSWDDTRPLGEGGLGVVFRGHVWGEEMTKGEESSEVAVKRCPHYIPRGDNRKALDSEVQNLFKLGTGDHPGLLKFVGWCDNGWYRYILTERLRGGDLFQAIVTRGNQLGSLTKVLDVIHQVFAAVAHMHYKGYAHYDLKPENLMFRDAAGSEVVVVDLGAACPPWSSWAGAGSDGYMAPEAYERGTINKVGPAADVFALGIVMYVLLTRNNPFRAATHEECHKLALVGVQDRHFDDLGGFFQYSRVGMGLRIICEAMVQPIPSDRIGIMTAVHWISQLRDIHEEECSNSDDLTDEDHPHHVIDERPDPVEAIYDIYLSLDEYEAESDGSDVSVDVISVGEEEDMPVMTTSWSSSMSTNGSTGVMPSSPNNQEPSLEVEPHPWAASWESLTHPVDYPGSASNHLQYGFEESTGQLDLAADVSIPSGKPGFGQTAKSLGNRFKRLFKRAA